MAITFKAEDLFSKYGFDDGNLVDDLLDDNGFDSHADIRPGRRLNEEVLAECVRRFLLPVLPFDMDIEDDCSRSHNPVRVAAKMLDVLHEGSFPGRQATVEVEAVLAVAREICERANLPAPGGRPGLG